MKINKRQEIALWTTGLLWVSATYICFGSPSSNDWIIPALLLVPMALIVFSLRDRNK